MAARKKKPAKKPAYTKLDVYVDLKEHIKRFNEELLKIPTVVDSFKRLDPKYLTQAERAEGNQAVAAMITNAPGIAVLRNKLSAEFVKVCNTPGVKFSHEFDEPMHLLHELFSEFAEKILAPLTYIVALVERIPDEKPEGVTDVE